MDNEHLAIENLCLKIGPGARVIRKNDPPAPDYTIEVGGEEVLVELSQYRESGPHNEAMERFWEFAHYFTERWRDDLPVHDISVDLRFVSKNGHFQIPTIRKNHADADTLIAELKELALAFKPDRPKGHNWVLFTVPDRLERSRRYRPDLRFAAGEDYPTASKYLEEVGLIWHPNGPAGLPQSNVRTRAAGLDTNALRRIVAQKHLKLSVYREHAKGREVRLLCYTEGSSTGRFVGPFAEPRAFEIVQSVVSECSDRFDRVWFGTDMLDERNADVHQVN